MAANELRIAFGEVMRVLRERAGLSQEELSFRCQRHRTFVSAVERGKNAPTLTTLWALAGALDISPSEFLRLVEVQLAEKQKVKPRGSAAPRQ